MPRRGLEQTQPCRTLGVLTWCLGPGLPTERVWWVLVSPCRSAEPHLAQTGRCPSGGPRDRGWRVQSASIGRDTGSPGKGTPSQPSPQCVSSGQSPMSVTGACTNMQDPQEGVPGEPRYDPSPIPRSSRAAGFPASFSGPGLGSLLVQRINGPLDPARQHSLLIRVAPFLGSTAGTSRAQGSVGTCGSTAAVPPPMKTSVWPCAGHPP